MTSAAPSMTKAWVIRHGAPQAPVISSSAKQKTARRRFFTLLAAHPFQTAGGMRPGWT
jgi:hypothetical protein